MLRRDPLVHFLVIGGLMFAVLSWLDSAPPSADGRERIVIGARQVAEIARAEALLEGHEPSQDELEAKVAEAVKDEVYYRRALELGLDENDDVVRQRLIEKLEYLTENTADPEPPEADLEAWFEANRGRFRIPERVSFDQVFLDPKLHGDALAADADKALAALAAGADPGDVGDPTPLNAHFEAADANRVRTLFEDELTEAVFSKPIGVWFGPVESAFGRHLVRVDARTPSRDPEFAEVEDEVRSAYIADRLAEANARAFAEMRSHFDIAVQWQAGGEPVPWP